MLATVQSGGVYGVEGFRVHVESDLRRSFEPRFEMVGLPEASVRESRVRVMAALRNTDIELPPAIITINFAPADRPKRGTMYDLPIAVGILASTKKVPLDRLGSCLIVGELALDGAVRPVQGALALALHAKETGLTTMVVPEDNAAELDAIIGLQIIPIASLSEMIDWLRGGAARSCPVPRDGGDAKALPDFSDVQGQTLARRAAEIAAAGGHNLLMVGPPGCGKTMIARRIPGILPTPHLQEQLETSRIWSVAGLLPARQGLIQNRPFRAPHHSLSVPALVGGGATPYPGEISLAHHGVLFLDELPEFRRPVLESLRQPLEDGNVCIVRGMQRAVFPSRSMLVAAMNPCPCGWLGSPLRPCRCPSYQVMSYRSRISGPLLDRIDLHAQIGSVVYQPGEIHDPGESTSIIRERVVQARNRQKERQQNNRQIVWNAGLDGPELRTYATPDDAGCRLLDKATHKLGLSARSGTRVVKVARTIADLAGRDQISAPDIAEAIQLRIPQDQKAGFGS